VHDPLADSDAVHHEYGIDLVPFEALQELEALVLAVPHREFASLNGERISELLCPKGVVVDVKSMLSREEVPASLTYWSL
jgi:UDP-N-acetyl-D-galactosamine dehydrogenase